MARINVLDKKTAELIAAGEVIERPSSVVKELVENAIDAGSPSVTVEIQNGGIRYIRVTDSGCGILREDVPRAFLRHATSKVASQEDLYRIGTLGFRGEALASIAAVAHVELLTRTAEEPLGTRYTIAGGDPGMVEEAGCPVGTTVLVRDLFYNVPARMKFLKKDVTEGNAIAALMDRLALSHPEISFKLIRKGQMKLHTPGDGKLLSAVYAVYGGDFGGGLIPVECSQGGLTVSGFISKPEKARATRSMEHFFINGRYIRSVTMLSALEEAYRNSMMSGKFPGCVLGVTLPCGMVDVNVHPAKLEVKLSDEKILFDAVYNACKGALARLDNTVQAADTSRRYAERTELPPQKQQPVRANPFRAPQRMTAEEYRKLPFEKGKKADLTPAAPSVSLEKAIAAQKKKGEEVPSGISTMNRSGSNSPVTASLQPPKERSGKMTLADQDPLRLYQSQLRQDRLPPEKTVPAPPASETASVGHRATATPAGDKQKTLEEPQTRLEGTPERPVRLIGEVFQTYLLAEREGELLLIDKHAAHERILFEKLKEAHRSGEVSRQVLLAPLRVSLPKDRYDAVLQNLSLLEKAGFAAEDFGDGSVLVREIPAVLDMAQVENMMEEIAEMLLRGYSRLDLEIYDELYHSIACKAAVKSGYFTGEQEARELVAFLQNDSAIRNCPHGRPVMIAMKKRELEKMFGRAL